ncbi:hypothetical protein CYMTET_39939, partial [Cymbomonas tetramitiformis]
MMFPSPYSSTPPTMTTVPAIQTTICEKTGGREVDMRMPPPTFTNAPAPAQGDSITPNNFIGLDDLNCFACAARVLISTAVTEQGSTGKRERSVVPEDVKLVAVITKEHVFFDLSVTVKNNFSTTAAAVLDVPRLPGLVLLEEHHRSGDIRYQTNVMEKKRADATFEQAAASKTHSATLSDTSEQSFSVKLDKIAKNTTATFGCRFIQTGGLRDFAAVVADGDSPGERIADVAVLPGFTTLEGEGVPFDFTLFISDSFDVQIPSHAVLLEDARTSENLVRDIKSILQLGPSLVEKEGLMKKLHWSTPGGLATGTLLK